MKFAGILVSALALTGALSVAPAFAQDATYTIGGKAVPAGQVDAVKAACDALRAAGNASTAASTDTSTGNTSGATAGGVASTDAKSETAANESLANSTDASTTANTAAADSTNKVTDGSGSDDAIDLAGLTIESCEAGGFKAAM